MEPETPSGSVETTLRLVADSQRRAVLRHLADSNGCEVSVDELASVVAANERPGVPGRSSLATLDSRLRHVHLPKLAEAGIVAYDHDGGRVTYVGANHVEALLAFVASELE